MRYLLTAGMTMQLLALPAFAQTATHPAPANAAPIQAAPAPLAAPSRAIPAASSSAVTPGYTAPANTTRPDTAMAPGGGLAGANSFTEAQARSRLEKNGFSNVSALVKDKDGVWRGRASKGSAEQQIGVDYKGNIITN